MSSKRRFGVMDNSSMDFEEQSSVDRLFEDKEDDSAFPDSVSDESESEQEDRDMHEANNRIK